MGVLSAWTSRFPPQERLGALRHVGAGTDRHVLQRTVDVLVLLATHRHVDAVLGRSGLSWIPEEGDASFHYTRYVY